MSELERQRLDSIVKEAGILFLLRNENIPDRWIAVNADKISDNWFDFMLYHGASEFVIDTFGHEIENECSRLGFLKNPFKVEEKSHVITMHKILRAAKKSLYKNDDLGYFENIGQRTGGLMPSYNQCIEFKRGNYSFHIRFNDLTIATHIYCMSGDITFPINVFEISEDRLVEFLMMIKKLFIKTFVHNTKIYDMIQGKTEVMMGGLYSTGEREKQIVSDMDHKINIEKRKLMKVVMPMVDVINDTIYKWQI